MIGCLSHTPTQDLACNPSMCPDWESNWRPFSSQASAQSTEPHQPGQQKLLFSLDCFIFMMKRIWNLHSFLLVLLEFCYILLRSPLLHISSFFVCFCYYNIESFFFFFLFFKNFYCYSITDVCLFSPSLHPTPHRKFQSIHWCLSSQTL